ncbi:MAG TPA: hypothetical protein PK263_05525 [bacterium]|nr:hypothetical protein [bacterium]
MDSLLRLVFDNKEWLFSGVGLVLVSWIGRIIYKRRQATSSQKIHSGSNSVNIQAGHDIKIIRESSQNDAKEK